MDELPTFPYSVEGDAKAVEGGQPPSGATQEPDFPKLGEGITHGSDENLYSMEEEPKYRSLPAFRTSFRPRSAGDARDVKVPAGSPGEFMESSFDMDLAPEPVYRSVSVESFSQPSLAGISPLSKLHREAAVESWEEEEGGLFSAVETVRTKLLPCPIYYEKSTSFRTPGFPKQIIASVVSILSSMNNVDILSTTTEKMKINAVAYIGDRAHAFKVYMWQWSDPEQCLIEFQKRTGSPCTFYRFFRAVRQKMWERGHSNSAEPLEDEFQRASISPDSQDRSEINPGFNLASLLQVPDEETEEEEEEKLGMEVEQSCSYSTGESTLRHLAKMAQSDYLNQKVQALRALAEVAQSPSADFAAMERSQVLQLLFKGLSSPHAEVQRIAAAVLAHVSEHLPASHQALGNHLDDFSAIFKCCPCRETVRRACRALCSIAENSMRKQEGRDRELSARGGGLDTLSGDRPESALFQVLRCLEIKQRACGSEGDPRLESMLARTLRSAGQSSQ